jgi:hypothetical protein
MCHRQDCWGLALFEHTFHRRTAMLKCRSPPQRGSIAGTAKAAAAPPLDPGLASTARANHFGDKLRRVIRDQPDGDDGTQG